MATGRPNGRPPKPVEARQGHRSKQENKITNANVLNFEIPTSPFKKLTNAEEIIWNYIWTGGQNWLKPERDLLVVFQTVMLWRDWTSEMSKLKSEGYVVEVTNGNGFTTNKKNERAIVVKDLWSQLNTQFSSLGFSPADAARLQLEAVNDEKSTALKNLMTQNRGQ